MGMNVGASMTKPGESSIGELAPRPEGTNIKRLVIGFMPLRCAEGEEFVKAHIRFQDGELFFPVLDALVYEGDELTIGGRKILREKGKEFWIVSLRTAENPTSIERHVFTPNVHNEGRAPLLRASLSIV